MMWRRRRRDPDPEPADCAAPTLPETSGMQEARHAREVSEAGLDEVRERWRDVTEMGARMREYTRRNGISRLFDEALGGVHDRDRR
ncbi:DUF7620 family protein [Herbidospora mongoliensis]|uniref:DUF7620 family protein n=1 Tax=Herbidospora mongoliensis TaxID=688067 RepID=UPI00082D1330|nr:hypothetical protein [Herbidospora mongoliensis]